MVKDILLNAGFVENETFIETVFKVAPKDTYCLYLRSENHERGDNESSVTRIENTIEMYMYKRDITSQMNLEKALQDSNVAYEKSELNWLDSEDMYMLVYTFDEIKKGA